MITAEVPRWIVQGQNGHLADGARFACPNGHQPPHFLVSAGMHPEGEDCPCVEEDGENPTHCARGCTWYFHCAPNGRYLPIWNDGAEMTTNQQDWAYDHANLVGIEAVCPECWEDAVFEVPNSTQ